MTGRIAPDPGRTYFPLMPPAFILRFLAIIALVLMPIGMVPGNHAMAASHHGSEAAPHRPAAVQAPGSPHCAEMAEAPDGERHPIPAPQQPDRSAECALACSALPSVAGIMAAPDVTPAIIHPLALAARRGLTPEATTPPPRNA